MTYDDFVRREVTRLKETLGFECSCGYKTVGMSFPQIIDHLVQAHGYNRRRLLKILRQSINEVAKNG